MFFNVRVFFIAAFAVLSASAACNNDNDCPGSEVCCTVLTGSGSSSGCIAQSDCVNSHCFTTIGEGSCDGG
ncbi:hypothetical protein K474DRAFT_1707525 [Panus rudis PR-1116 ss-1]|nr:hypothetical protein K474DRAFT_1707525 [Panus rudis PR-1116 ss-1]